MNNPDDQPIFSDDPEAMPYMQQVPRPPKQAFMRDFAVISPFLVLVLAFISFLFFVKLLPPFSSSLTDIIPVSVISLLFLILAVYVGARGYRKALEHNGRRSFALVGLSVAILAVALWLTSLVFFIVNRGNAESRYIWRARMDAHVVRTALETIYKENHDFVKIPPNMNALIALDREDFDAEYLDGHHYQHQDYSWTCSTQDFTPEGRYVGMISIAARDEAPALVIKYDGKGSQEIFVSESSR